MRIVDLATATGLSQSRINNWVHGKHDPKSEYLGLLAAALSVSEEWLLHGVGPMNLGPTDRAVHRGATRMVPIYGAINAGPAANLAGDVVEWYEMRDWGNSHERWGRVVSGLSMEPALLPWDFAIFEARQWEVGHVVHAFNAGDDTVKQVRRKGEVVELCPLNPDFECIPSSGWNIKGVCVAVVRKESDGAIVLREYADGLRPKTFF